MVLLDTFSDHYFIYNNISCHYFVVAFAELQTEVTDFTSDINIIGIPFWDYRSYTFKVLFPSHTDHPVLHNSSDYYTTKYGSYDQGLHQFNQLINSKQFLLIFIRTLEQQRNFSIRDRFVSFVF